jgi:hypothetical protein
MIWRWLLAISKICALLPLPNGSKRINLSLDILPETGNGVTSRNVKSSPVTGLEWPRGFQEVKVPRFLDNGTVWW